MKHPLKDLANLLHRPVESATLSGHSEFQKADIGYTRFVGYEN
jgi:hypothetical protein